MIQFSFAIKKKTRFRIDSIYTLKYQVIAYTGLRNIMYLACKLYYFCYFTKYLKGRERERVSKKDSLSCRKLCPVGRTMERGVSCQWRDHLGNSDFVHEEDR